MTVERDLVSARFVPKADGSLTSPARVVLMPAGDFYRLSIELSDGAALTCFIACVALKVQHGGERP